MLLSLKAEKKRMLELEKITIKFQRLEKENVQLNSLRRVNKGTVVNIINCSKG